SHRDVEDVGDLAILQPLVIGQDQHLLEEVGEPFDPGPDVPASLAGAGHIERGGFAALQHLAQPARLALGLFHPRLFEADGLMPAVAPQRVNRLVRGDRVEPGPHGPAGLVVPALDVELEEGVLEDVFRQAGVTQVAAQVSVQLALIAADEQIEGLRLAATEAQQQLLVGTMHVRVASGHGSPVMVYWSQATAVRAANRAMLTERRVVVKRQARLCFALFRPRPTVTPTPTRFDRTPAATPRRARTRSLRSGPPPRPA